MIWVVLSRKRSRSYGFFIYICEKQIIMRNLAIILLLALASCGSRKSEVNIQKDETKKETSIDIKSESVTDIKNDITVHSDILDLTFTPIDTSKAIEIVTPDGKKYSVKNSVIQKRSDKSIMYDKTELRNTKQEEVKSEIKESQKTYSKEKKTDRDNTLFWVFAWVGIFLILFVLGRMLKNKSESIV